GLRYDFRHRHAGPLALPFWRAMSGRLGASSGPLALFTEALGNSSLAGAVRSPAASRSARVSLLSSIRRLGTCIAIVGSRLRPLVVAGRHCSPVVTVRSLDCG